MSHVLTLEELDANPWCSCGPAALATLLGRPLSLVRDAFPRQQPGRTWTNLRQMQDALSALKLSWEMTCPLENRCTRGVEWPHTGLAILQFEGSWSELPPHHAAQLQRTHWIAVKPWRLPPGAQLVFDVNAIDDGPPTSLGWWQPRASWEQLVVPEVVRHFGRTATGRWWVRAGIEVEVP